MNFDIAIPVFPSLFNCIPDSVSWICCCLIPVSVLYSLYMSLGSCWVSLKQVGCVWKPRVSVH